MKIISRSAVDRIGLSLLKKALVYGTLALTGLAAYPFLELHEKYKSTAAAVAAGIIVLIGGLGAFLVLPSAVSKMQEDPALYLSEAITHTLFSYLLLAAFLPVIGPVFGRILDPKGTDAPPSAEDQ